VRLLLNQIHRLRQLDGGSQVLGKADRKLFDGCRLSVLQYGKGSGDGMHNSVSVFNTAEIYT
jgi:hypothetical protein